jgi:ABC-2 type transport system permease protein
MTRIVALLGKELADLQRNPGVFVPAVLTGVISLLLPFFVALVVPALTGERLSASSDFEIAVRMYQMQPGARALDPEGAIQAWIFQQFLILLVLAPVAASMAVAAYSVVGEKQARTLEPLLATPITTFQLLAAKVLGALIPSFALTLALFAVYVAGVIAFANPGVFTILLTGRALATVLLFAPMAALAALQRGVCVSSRVNDSGSAQQIGALIILPIAGLLVAQLTGSVQLTGARIVALSGLLAIVNAGLMRLGVGLFDRESILTRWK